MTGLSLVRSSSKSMSLSPRFSRRSKRHYANAGVKGIAVPVTSEGTRHLIIKTFTASFTTRHETRA